MERNRIVKWRNLNFQTLDARLAFDADSVVSDPQIDDTRVFDLETVDMGVVSGQDDRLEMLAFFSVSQSELVEESDLQDVELQVADMQRSDDPQAKDVDLPKMTLGSVQFDFDTNNDGALAAADALIIINALNARNLNGNATIANGASESSIAEFNAELDINRDGSLSPIDALLVINALNLQASVDGANLVADESAKFADTQLTDLPGELTEVEDSIAMEVDDTSETSLALSMMRIAGATEVKIDGVSGFPTIALAVDAEGRVVANAGDETLAVTIDENNALSIAGVAVPIAIVSIGDSQQFVPYPIEDEKLSVAWPWSFEVDNALAYM